MTKIRKRQAKFVGHVIRRNQLEHLVTTGKFDGKRGRGRPREKMLDSLADWMNIEKPSDMIRKMSCRDGWLEVPDCPRQPPWHLKKKKIRMEAVWSV
ncbi:hypothetical protein ElyMa_006978700 [Elysia marginata]|uniref:Uncharacterized protein n=1 Tax=Elysia marginata TaxID=1093978 RepID=A0AAV4JMJ2_9GAST|nr:hypothetical protein ElyMa_006978700 [Elysia marginata]